MGGKETQRGAGLCLRTHSKLVTELSLQAGLLAGRPQLSQCCSRLSRLRRAVLTAAGGDVCPHCCLITAACICPTPAVPISGLGQCVWGCILAGLWHTCPHLSWCVCGRCGRRASSEFTKWTEPFGATRPRGTQLLGAGTPGGPGQGQSGPCGTRCEPVRCEECSIVLPG